MLTNFTRSGFMASSDHFTALIDERNKQEGKWWRNEAGQPENACRGVIETLPVGVIPYREAYLPVLCKMVVSKQLLCTVPTRAFKRVAWKSAKEIRNPKSLD